MVRRVVWDDAKAKANWRKHHVTFEEAAATLSSDPFLQVEPDEHHSSAEDRFIAVGESGFARVLLFIVYTIREDDAWLITAREATGAERRRFMRGDMIRDEHGVESLSDSHKTVRVPPRYIQRVGLDDDVAQSFPSSASVNAALHRLIDEGRAPAPLDIEFHIPRSVLEGYEPPAEYDMSNWNPIPRHIFPPITGTQVSVELDLTRYFPDDEAINAALRTLIAEDQRHTP